MKPSFAIGLVSCFLGSVTIASGSAADARSPKAPSVTPEELDVLRSVDYRSLTAEQFVVAYPEQVQLTAESTGLSDTEAAKGLMMQEPAAELRERALWDVAEFGGAFLDWSGVPVLVVTVTTQPAEGLDAILSDAKAAGISVRVEPALYTYRELERTAQEATDLLAKDPSIEPGSTAVYVDERSNRVVIQGTSPDMEAAVSRELGARRDQVQPDLPGPEERIELGTEIPGGWDARSSIGCTMGFSVVSPTNQAGVLTAGHCGDGTPVFNGVTLSGALWESTNYVRGMDRQIHVAPSPHTAKNLVVAHPAAISRSSAPRLIAGSKFFAYGASGDIHCDGRAAVNEFTAGSYTTEGNLVGRSTLPMGLAGGRILVPGDSGGPAYMGNAPVGIFHKYDNVYPDDYTNGVPDPVKVCDNNDPDMNTHWVRADRQLSGTDFMITEGPASGAGNYAGMGTYHTVNPYRVYDSRPAAPILNGQSVNIDVDNNAQIGADSGSFALTITAIPVSGSGVVRAYPNHSLFPVPVDTIATTFSSTTGATSGLVVVRDNGAGGVTLKVEGGSTASVDLVVDVTGYFSAPEGTAPLGNGAAYQILATPTRLFDSRYTGYGSVPLGPGGIYNVDVVGGASPAPSTTTVAVLNVTAVAPTATTYLTVWPAGTPMPATSNLNVAPGDTMARLVMVPVSSANPEVSVFNNAGNTHVVVDIIGYMTQSFVFGDTAGRGLFSGSRRVYSSGSNGAPTSLAPGQSIEFFPTAESFALGPIDSAVQAYILNVTAQNATGPGYIVVHRGLPAPNVSTVNYSASESESNLVLVGDDQYGNVRITNGGAYSVAVRVDVMGWILA